MTAVYSENHTKRADYVMWTGLHFWKPKHVLLTVKKCGIQSQLLLDVT